MRKSQCVVASTTANNNGGAVLGKTYTHRSTQCGE